MFFKKESRVQKCKRYALAGLGIVTNIAFLGACVSVIRQTKDIEEQKMLLQEHLQMYNRDLNDRQRMYHEMRQDAAMQTQDLR